MEMAFPVSKTFSTARAGALCVKGARGAVRLVQHPMALSDLVAAIEIAPLTPAAAPIAGTIFGFRPGFVHCQAAAVQVGAIQGGNGGLRFLRRAHGYETETPGTAALAVHHQVGFYDRAMRRECVLKIIFSRVEGNVSYKQFCTHSIF